MRTAHPADDAAQSDHRTGQRSDGKGSGRPPPRLRLKQFLLLIVIIIVIIQQQFLF
jgi:hypothetical protein